MGVDTVAAAAVGQGRNRVIIIIRGQCLVTWQRVRRERTSFSDSYDG